MGSTEAGKLLMIQSIFLAYLNTKKTAEHFLAVALKAKELVYRFDSDQDKNERHVTCTISVRQSQTKSELFVCSQMVKILAEEL
jgi:hypothetical protein